MEEENWYGDLYNFFSPDMFRDKMRKDKKSAENHWLKTKGNLVYEYFNSLFNEHKSWFLQELHYFYKDLYFMNSSADWCSNEKECVVRNLTLIVSNHENTTMQDDIYIQTFIEKSLDKKNSIGVIEAGLMLCSVYGTYYTMRSLYDAIRNNAFNSVIFLQYAENLMRKFVSQYTDMIKIDIKDLDNKISKIDGKNITKYEKNEIAQKYALHEMLTKYSKNIKNEKETVI